MNIARNNRTVAAILMYMSVFIDGLKCSGAITEVVPRTKSVLKMFDPTMFPIAMSECFLYAAIPVAASSGSDVPSATIVSPIIDSDNPKFCAIVVAPSTTHLLPNPSPANPNIRKRMDVDVAWSLIPLWSSEPWTLDIPYV